MRNIVINRVHAQYCGKSRASVRASVVYAYPRAIEDKYGGGGGGEMWEMNMGVGDQSWNERVDV